MLSHENSKKISIYTWIKTAANLVSIFVRYTLKGQKDYDYE